MFVIMLDGIDEAPSDCLQTLLKSIKRFRDEYRQSPLVCSVRPGTQLPNVPNMTHLMVADMVCDQIVEVLERSPFSEDRKRALIYQTRGGLYEQHKSFLSNPLLATIMLITFDDASRVPSKISIFYAEAYKALFSRHDWSKGIFTRERRTNLDIDQFAKAFRIFCFNSYIRRVFTFSDEDLRIAIGDSLSHARLDATADDYITDCILSVCLLQEDPPTTTFVHRSFQEYFAADFVGRYAGPNAAALVRLLVERVNTDNSYKMLCQMNQMLVIRSWAIGAAKSSIDEFCLLLDSAGADKYKTIFDYVGIGSLGFDIETGELVAFGFSVANAKYARFECIFMAADPDEHDKLFDWLKGSVLGERGLGGAPEPLRRLLRTNVQDSTWAMVDVNKLQGAWVEQSGLPQIVDSLRLALTQAHDMMIGLVQEEDSLTEVTELIS